MKWVYSVCFVGDRFVMVHNKNRKGWEMPGGRMEVGESPEQAAVREVREECGCDLVPWGSMERRDGAVFCGELRCLADAERGAEMEWELFSELPSPLSFGEDEYKEVLDWAYRVMRERSSDPSHFRSSF